MSSSNFPHPWTLAGLFRIFLELNFAYFLLYISFYVFLASEFLQFFGLHFPCPCNGIFGYKNSDLCLHKLLIDWPTGKIYSVLNSIISSFPIDLLLSKITEACKDLLKNSVIEGKNSENGILRLEEEKEAFSSPKTQNKGKRTIVGVNKQRTRRRKREKVVASQSRSTSLDLVLNNNSQLEPDLARKTSWEKINSIFDGEKAGFHGEIEDDVKEPYFADFGSGISEIGQDKNVKENEMNDIDVIGALEKALGEERAACAALYLELEKERAASATAADEAMAMISRLQNDKAAIEIEVRQYQRMIEERFAYDEDEMEILREILIRREVDNHLLKKEIEAYRKIDILRNGKYNKGDLRRQQDSTNIDQACGFENNLLYSDGEYFPTEHAENMDQVGSNLPLGFELDVETHVQDIHVIDE